MTDFPKKCRLKGKKNFQTVYKGGIRLTGQSIKVFFYPATSRHGWEFPPLVTAATLCGGIE